jgi:hypothetical protein
LEEGGIRQFVMMSTKVHLKFNRSTADAYHVNYILYAETNTYSGKIKTLLLLSQPLFFRAEYAEQRHVSNTFTALEHLRSATLLPHYQLKMSMQLYFNLRTLVYKQRYRK